jgi:hypothetical protein
LTATATEQKTFGIVSLRDIDPTPSGGSGLSHADSADRRLDYRQYGFAHTQPR